MRVLIHNSDSPANRGDRAILAGLIELVRRTWPDAEIWSLSQFPERDEAWFGIRFLAQSPYSTNPLHWLALARLARRSDIVLWGGGEILKDYTNKLGLFYWLVKLKFLAAANPTIVGAFQGIGPTGARISQRLIAATVQCTRVFLVRDAESRDKLIAWGVATPIVASFDPAVLATVAPRECSVDDRLRAAGIDADALDGAIGFGLRRWFHYRSGGWLPQRFRRTNTVDTPRLFLYRRRAALLADRLVMRYNTSIVFFPMHLDDSEGDASFARDVIELMVHADRAIVIDADVFSPSEYAGLIGRLRLFVASRLHSAIVATVAGVPSYVLYYVDKGRLYFEQLGLERYSAPIDSILGESAVDTIEAAIVVLDGEATAIRSHLAVQLDGMSRAIEQNFDEALAYLGDDDMATTRIH